MQQDAMAAFDLPTTLRFAEIALASLGEAREEIDALNVYPVPDGDTGTNMFLTFESARNAMLAVLDDDGNGDLHAALAAFARGALLGARGNSGVILSQLVGAVARRIVAAGPGESTGAVFADAMREATDASYAAVGEPMEGTILTVARAASEAAARAASEAAASAVVPDVRMGAVVRAAASAAREALGHTPEQLPALRDAGVVDAGGRGLCVILDAAETALTGKQALDRRPPLRTRTTPVAAPSGRRYGDGPTYEVTYLLEAADDQVPLLRRRLSPLGDSLVVVGGERLWNVHVHVDDAGAAVEAAMEVGRPHRIRITALGEQLARPSQCAGGASVSRRKVVAVAAGEGLASLFTQAGALVVPTGPGRRPSASQILDAVNDAGTEEVVVLPNEKESVAVAQAAARAAEQQTGRRVGVVPTTAQVQGLAALAVHEPGRTFEEDVLAMTSAARHARSGAVTVAARRAITTAGPCEAGDVLGVVEGDFVLVGEDLLSVATGVLERLLGGGGEMVTLVAGAGGDDLAQRCADYLAAGHPSVDVVMYEGGQERYPLLVAVE